MDSAPAEHVSSACADLDFDRIMTFIRINAETHRMLLDQISLLGEALEIDEKGRLYHQWTYMLDMIGAFH